MRESWWEFGKANYRVMTVRPRCPKMQPRCFIDEFTREFKEFMGVGRKLQLTMRARPDILK
jgi:hypothetical protein